VADCPAHMVRELTVTTGNGFTVTVVVIEFDHPLALVPVTVYVVVLAGLTIIGLDVEVVDHK